MKSKYIFLLFLLLFTTNHLVFSQGAIYQYSRPFSGTQFEINAPVISHDSKILFTGFVYSDSTASGIYTKPLLMKVNYSGSIDWAYSYPFGNSTTPKNLIQAKGKDYFILAESDTYTDEHYLLRINDLGTPVWCSVLNDDRIFFSRIIGTQDSGCVIMGRYINPMNVKCSLLIKYDKWGNILWTKAFSYSYSMEGGQQMALNGFEKSNGDLVILGEETHTVPPGYLDTYSYLSEFDKNGNLKWYKWYPIPGHPTISTTIFISAIDSNNIIFAYNYHGAHLIKTDSVGNILFSYEYKFPIHGIISGLVVTQSNIYLTGDNAGTMSDRQAYVAKISNNGNPLNIKLLNNSIAYVAYPIIKNNSLIFTGRTGLMDYNSRLLIITDTSTISTCYDSSLTINKTPVTIVPESFIHFYTYSITPTLKTINRVPLILNQVDLCSVLSSVVEEEKNPIQINIYPNPTSEIISIETNEAVNGEVIIRNISGQIIRRESINSSLKTLNISNLNNGTYILSVQSENESIRKVFIKN